MMKMKPYSISSGDGRTLVGTIRTSGVKFRASISTEEYWDVINNIPNGKLRIHHILQERLDEEYRRVLGKLREDKINDLLDGDI